MGKRILNEFYRFKLVEKDTIVGPRQYIEHPGAVSIIAVNDKGEILLERNNRVNVDKELIELPSGLVEDNEGRLDTAKRELLEECGYEARKWKELFTYFSSAGILDETTTVYLATDLIKRKRMLDKSEEVTQLDTFFMNPEDILNMVESGQECYGPMVPALAYGYKLILKKGE